ncbi:MAG: hypothetical protein N2491_12405 [Negativicutes bacterium]|nr:hypothetical protein [Negativicutes bacterium]
MERSRVMQRKLRRLGTRHKYKKFVAAVAGAAVISSTMLPGLPAMRAHAASNPSAGEFAAAVSGEQMTAGDLWQRAEKNETNQENRSFRNAERHDRRADQSPVQVVRDNAASFGFDADNDRFSLLANSGSKAVVRVWTGDQTFKVDLVRSGDSWEITTIRGIGDMTHPATYIPAKFFSYRPVNTAAIIPAGDQTILYQTDNFRDWKWQEAHYPADMSFGLLLQDPRLEELDHLVPAGILARMEDVDFSRQFVFYAHLGTVGANGYGIAVEKVARDGDNLTITVRAKSPVAGEKPTISIVDTYIILDRGLLKDVGTTKITVVDQTGKVLATYTVNRS